LKGFGYGDRQKSDGFAEEQVFLLKELEMVKIADGISHE
jgi:hypothetical protein